jgi:hypothetical protein
MNPELYADSSPTILNYTINPSQVIIATQNDFSLVITNPASAQPVTLDQGNQDQIQVSFPAPPEFTGADALTDSLSFTAQSLTDGFIAGQLTQGSNPFVIQPMGVQTLLPGHSIKIQFKAVTVNGETGSPKIQIEEFIGESDQKTTLAVEKLPQQLHVIGWLDPWTVGLEQQSTLYWQSFGGTSVDVIGFPGGTGIQNFPVSGNPPYPGNTKVTVPPDQAQRTYTLRVKTNDQRHAEMPVTLSQQSPMIIQFEAVSPPTEPLGPTQQVNLIWHTLFTKYAYLQTPVDNSEVLPDMSTPTPFTPGVDAYKGNDRQSIPDKVDYILQACGYKESATSTVTFKIGQVKVLYFKYAKMDGDKLSGIIYLLDPPEWAGSNLSLANVNKLTVYQPGETTTVLWLGSADTVHPQVQFFDAVSGQGGKFTLRWVTANLKSLVLKWNGQSYTVPSAQIAKGTYEVTPTRTTNYMLEATGTNGETVTSTLAVNVTS